VGRHALAYEPDFDAAALEKIQAGFADIVPLTDKPGRTY
jgi:hypothetical protein